jgi:4-amino-4-deoxychorismate lyase
MVLPHEGQVRSEAEALFTDRAGGVLKLIVTRGSGGRGYASADTPANWMLSPHPLPITRSRDRVSLRWCATRLATQPALAGIKHCNRLEQVLARAEWADPATSGLDADEGLMCSSEGDVVCAISANLFVLRDSRWLTPKVDRCGVEGICRGQLLPLLDAHEVRLSVADVESGDAVFLCNAVRGILGVARLGTRTWSSHPSVAEARRVLAPTHPGFSIDAEIS